MEYSLPEIVEMAVQTELGGKLFYETIAARTDNAALRRLFEFLADEEKKHVRVFSELARNTTPAPEELPYDFDEVALYLKAIVDSRYFLEGNKALALAGKADTARKALEYALAFEKETMLFYLELLNMVSERNREPVRALVSEERRHVRRLQELLASL